MGFMLLVHLSFFFHLFGSYTIFRLFNIHTYIHTHTHTHTYIHTYTHIYTHIHIYAYIVYHIHYSIQAHSHQELQL